MAIIQYNRDGVDYIEPSRLYSANQSDIVIKTIIETDVTKKPEFKPGDVVEVTLNSIARYYVTYGWSTILPEYFGIKGVIKDISQDNRILLYNGSSIIASLFDLAKLPNGIELHEAINYIESLSDQPLPSLYHKEINGLTRNGLIKCNRDNKILLLKPGRWFKSKFNLSDKEVEEYSNKCKALLSPIDIKVVTGDDIIKYYDESTYLYPKIGTLGNSCMKLNTMKNRIISYKALPVSLVVGFLDNKVVARALLWTTNTGLYLDRIYYTYDNQSNSILKWAKEHNIKTRPKQNSRTVDSPDLSIDIPYFKGLSRMDISNTYNSATLPYMDTFKYLILEEIAGVNTWKLSSKKNNKICIRTFEDSGTPWYGNTWLEAKEEFELLIDKSLEIYLIK